MGEIERRWRRGITRRQALGGLASFLAGSPGPAARATRPVAARPAPALPRLRRDAGRVRLRADLPRQRAPRGLRLHGPRHRVGVHALPQPRCLRLGAADRPRRGRSGRRRHSTELFGHRMPSPILLAPTARQRDLHPDGELGMHRAATTTGTTMIVSNASSFPFPRIAEAAEGPLWFQRYATRETEPNQVALGTAQEAGAQTIVVTIDQQASYYERDLHDRHLGGSPRRVTRARAGEPAQPLPRQRRPALVRVEALRRSASDVRGPDAGQGHPDRRGRRRSAWSTASTASSSPTMADAPSTTAPPAWRCSRRWSRRWADASRCSSTAGSAAAAMRSRRSPSAPTRSASAGPPAGGLGAFGEEGAQRVLEILDAELRQADASVGVASISESTAAS